MLSAPAAMFGEPTIVVSDATAVVGDIVDLQISIENNPGVAAMRLLVQYDESMLRLDGVADGGLFGEPTTSEFFGSPYTVMWINGDGVDMYVTDEVLMTLYFEVLEEGYSEVLVGYADGDIVNADFDRIIFGVTNGSVDGLSGTVERELLYADAYFVSIQETSKNSRVWTLTFDVLEVYTDGTEEIVTYSIDLYGNNANLDGSYDFEEGTLEGLTLQYDIKGNGSNIKSFVLW